MVKIACLYFNHRLNPNEKKGILCKINISPKKQTDISNNSFATKNDKLDIINVTFLSLECFKL